jgi:hypothetical protein
MMKAEYFNNLVDTIHTQTKTFLNTIDPSETFTKPARAMAEANTNFAKSYATATESLTTAYTNAVKS